MAFAKFKKIGQELTRIAEKHAILVNLTASTLEQHNLTASTLEQHTIYKQKTYMYKHFFFEDKETSCLNVNFKAVLMF